MKRSCRVLVYLLLGQPAYAAHMHVPRLSSVTLPSGATPIVPVRMAATGQPDALSWAAPRLALLAMAGTCGANFPLLHMTESVLSPPDVALFRFSCALLPFLPSAAKQLSKYGTSDRTLIPGLEIGAWCSLGYVTQAIGLSMTSPTRGAFICALFLVVTPLLNGFQGRKVEAQAWLAVGIALFGTACLEGLLPLPFAVDAASAAADAPLAAVNAGDLWCGGTALGFGAMFSRMEAHMDRLGEDEALPMTAWQLVALFFSCVGWRLSQVDGLAQWLGAAPDGVGGWISSVASACSAEPMLLPAILFMGFISGALVLWGETLLLKNVPSTEAGVIFATEPVWAAAFAAMLLNDAITTEEWIGGGAIVLACLALQLPESAVLGALQMAPAEAAAAD